MKFADFSLINTWLELGLCFLIFLIFFIVLLRFKPKPIIVVILLILVSSVFASIILCLNNLLVVSMVIFGVVICVFFMSNLNFIRTKLMTLLWNNKRGVLSHNKPIVNKIFDRSALINEIYETVLDCSKRKVGALMTFERKDDLTPFLKNGTTIKAPVSKELLMTIFYPGTRLHDGAVVIRNNVILAASVYYTPSTKALSGKYGSRHRAAIGISDNCDALTVVVSEETGRISFAHDGELEPTTLDVFKETFEELLKEKDI